jgi:hypothetical protein
VQLDDHGHLSTRLFTGQIVGSYPRGTGRGQIDVGYRALGLNWLVNNIWITGPDGAGTILYNMPTTDTGDYIATNAGLSVGEILKRIFNLHWPQLTAVGVVAFSDVELELLTAVPPEPVVIQGRLWNAVQQLVLQWCNKYLIWISADGIIHCQSALKLPQNTLTLDQDPVILDEIHRDHSECYTQAVMRGGDWVEGAYLRLSDKTLFPLWTMKQQLAWSINDFLQPKGASDTGTVSSMTSTSLTVSSDSATTAWLVNQLSDIDAEVWAYNPLSADLTFMEQRRVTANTAMTAGGSMTITVDYPFNNTGYTRYSIRGSSVPQSLVYRAFGIGPVDMSGNNWVAQHLVRTFSHSLPWSPSDGVVVQTFTPQANICWSPSGMPPYTEIPATFQIVQYDGVTNGYIIFDVPVVTQFGTPANLQQGGAAVDGIPDDIIVLVPYSKGAITATAPVQPAPPLPPAYQGTAYTVDGITRPTYRDFPQWLDYGQSTQFQTLAQEVLDTVKNTVVEGQASYYGKYDAFLQLGQALNIAQADGLVTGYEAINAPIRGVVLDYQQDSTVYLTQVQFSNRLRPFSGDRLYVHPWYGGQATLGGGGFGTAVAVGTSASFAGLRDFGQDVAGNVSASFGEAGDRASGALGQAGETAGSFGGEAEQFEGGFEGPGQNTYKGPREGKSVDRSAGRKWRDVQDLITQQDQSENARRAAAAERRAIEERNAEKAADRDKIMPDAVLDEHLKGID